MQGVSTRDTVTVSISVAAFLITAIAELVSVITFHET
jgi:hypothetical protein